MDEWVTSGNRPGASMEPTGAPRGPLPCGACGGVGTRGRHQQIGAGDCAWCSGRGWNYTPRR